MNPRLWSASTIFCVLLVYLVGYVYVMPRVELAIRNAALLWAFGGR